MAGRTARGRCTGTSGAGYHETAWELRGSNPPPQWEDRVRTLAFSNRFVVVWRDPLITIYLGENGDYVLVDSYYCSCPGFTMRTTRRGLGGCSHVYALREALRNGRVRDVSSKLSAGMVAEIAWEALTGPYAFTLRRILALGEEVGENNDHGEGGGDED